MVNGNFWRAHPATLGDDDASHHRTVHPDDTLLAVARQLRDARVGALLVIEQGDYVGIVSEADLVRKAMASGAVG